MKSNLKYYFIISFILFVSFYIIYTFPKSILSILDINTSNQDLKIGIVSLDFESIHNVDSTHAGINRRNIYLSNKEEEELLEILDDFKYRKNINVTNSYHFDANLNYGVIIYIFREDSQINEIVLGNSYEVLIDNKKYRIGYYGEKEISTLAKRLYKFINCIAD